MVRRVTPAQLRALQRQQIQKINREASKHNAKVRQYNSKVRQAEAKQRRAIDAFNRELRSYDSRMRTNRARLKSELQRLARLSNNRSYSTLRHSVNALSTAYSKLDSAAADPYLSDLAEQEAANSVASLNSLLGDAVDAELGGVPLNDTLIADQLAQISPDLDESWKGAIFALNPENPEAARHFCASTREIITTILDTAAPDEEVFTLLPGCKTTDRGTPTRRSKVHYCLVRNGRADDDLEAFVDADIKNIVTLFGELNAGTHEQVGRFSGPQLIAIKTRVEDAIRFMCEIIN